MVVLTLQQELIKAKIAGRIKEFPIYPEEIEVLEITCPPIHDLHKGDILQNDFDLRPRDYYKIISVSESGSVSNYKIVKC